MTENKKRPMTEARKQANAKFDSKAYDRILLRVRAGRKEEMEAHAARFQPEAGEVGKAGYSPAGSLQGFISRAVDETMARDRAKASAQGDNGNS